MVVLCLVLVSPLTAESKLEEVAWLSGNWSGEENDTLIQENWSEPAGNAMMGSFRMIKGNEVVFYEFMLIEQTPEGVVLRIKHFKPGLDGMESKDESVDLGLASAEEGKAVFETERDGNPEYLTYQKTSEGGMTITLDKPAKDSSTVFRFDPQ